MIGHLTDQVLTHRDINATAAGTTVVNGAGFDTQGQGFDGVRGVACLGALTATQTTALKLQDSPDNAAWTDLPGSQTANMADGDSNKMCISDRIKTFNRYVRAV